ncbi:MAG: hypothetical protein HQL89_11415 [Magnetococcales bacterium]|nr:hypothetical protein [Magnetococcales bacterium]
MEETRISDYKTGAGGQCQDYDPLTGEYISGGTESLSDPKKKSHKTLAPTKVQKTHDDFVKRKAFVDELTWKKESAPGIRRKAFTDELLSQNKKKTAGRVHHSDNTQPKSNRYPKYTGEPDSPLEDVYPELEIAEALLAVKGTIMAGKGIAMASKEIVKEFKRLKEIGPEYPQGGKKFRVAPFGNRRGNPLGEFPHYHRPGRKNPRTGEPRKGQGKNRHRPWEKSDYDKSFWDRF